MTLEEAINCQDPSKLEEISDAEWLEIMKPYLCVTRPELANKDKPRTVKQSSFDYSKSADYQAKMSVAKALAAKMGIKLDI